MTSVGIMTFRRGDRDIMTRREARNLEMTGQVKIVGDPQDLCDVAVEIEWDDDAADASS